ncbi:hypothetical protein B296_00052199 [Ensete ventricosum]|uniref:Uncharacterized protein n=1 Tax=Ensete ventricosum TaxID=4639 RepID=A0A426Y3H5_ENSVE|nr:hypothetical protein B296_00052199 [Ensete ventricosum]
MGFAVCFGTSGARDTFVKIIHPGGHVEYHNRPVLASQIMSHNPGCWVTQPDVFHQPCWAVVAPDTQLFPGQKFYVVPMTTVRKLRRHFLRNSTLPPPPPPPPLCTMASSVDPSPAAEGENSLTESSCLHRLTSPFSCLTHRSKSWKQERAASELMVCGGNSRRSKESPKREMSPKKRQGNASPGTPSGYWQPNLGSITEE